MYKEQSDYGMFTEGGDAMIEKFVQMAKRAQLSAKTVVQLLEVISKEETYQEAADTVVREKVLDELGLL